MPHGHDFAGRGVRGCKQLPAERRQHVQRVVAAELGRIRQAAEQPGAVVVDRAGATVQRLAAIDCGTERAADRLVAEADA